MQSVVMPSSDENMWMEIEKNFCNKWNFPNLIGAVDGKHVVIKAPPHSGSNYFCYKKTFSTVLLALVDADYRFIAIDVGARHYSGDQASVDEEKKVFNYRLSRARSVVENALITCTILCPCNMCSTTDAHYCNNKRLSNLTWLFH
jgi:hypothetical protein